MAKRRMRNDRSLRLLASAALAALAAAGCDNPSAPGSEHVPAGPSFAPGPVAITQMRGAGAIGPGEPTSAGGVNRQVFSLEVGVNSNIVFGTFDYVDSSFTKDDGRPPHFVVGPDWPGTAVATFVQISNTCVEFDGVGRLLNTDELLSFRAQACDNGHPGVGLDVFAIFVPQRFITDATLYQRGPDMLSIGELTLSGPEQPSVVITHAAGDGAIGDGAPIGLGVNRQVFALDVGLDNGVVTGTLAYTDSSAIMAADGRPATLVVDLSAPGSAFTTFVQVSDACVEFSGVGLLRNTGELLAFGGRVCDGGPGFLDIFGIWVPSETYRRGPDMLIWGDIGATVVTGSS